MEPWFPITSTSLSRLLIGFEAQLVICWTGYWPSDLTTEGRYLLLLWRVSDSPFSLQCVEWHPRNLVTHNLFGNTDISDEPRPKVSLILSGGKIR